MRTPPRAGHPLAARVRDTAQDWDGGTRFGEVKEEAPPAPGDIRRSGFRRPGPERPRGDKKKRRPARRPFQRFGWSGLRPHLSAMRQARHHMDLRGRELLLLGGHLAGLALLTMATIACSPQPCSQTSSVSAEARSCASVGASPRCPAVRPDTAGPTTRADSSDAHRTTRMAPGRGARERAAQGPLPPSRRPRTR